MKSHLLRANLQWHNIVTVVFENLFYDIRQSCGMRTANTVAPLWQRCDPELRVFVILAWRIALSLWCSWGHERLGSSKGTGSRHALHGFFFRSEWNSHCVNFSMCHSCQVCYCTSITGVATARQRGWEWTEEVAASLVVAHASEVVEGM